MGLLSLNRSLGLIELASQEPVHATQDREHAQPCHPQPASLGCFNSYKAESSQRVRGTFWLEMYIHPLLWGRSLGQRPEKLFHNT